jgi:hypothetical protein
MMFKTHAIASLFLVGAFAGCAGARVGITEGGGNSGNGGGGGGAGSSGLVINLDAKAPLSNTPDPDPGADPIACDNPSACADFPKDPIKDGTVPSDPGSQFSGNPSGTLCVIEPEDGSLFPYNWTRPRIKWTGASGLVQITVHADIEANDLVAYTTNPFWIMPKDIWTNLSKHVHEQDISVTVRAASGGATTVKFQIASASAAGSIVYWAADPTAVGQQPDPPPSANSSFLRGFTVGEEGVVDTLKFTDVKQPSRGSDANVRTPRCVGCHSATPEPGGGYVAFVDHWPWASVIAGVKTGIVGDQLPSLSVGGLAALNKPWAGAAAFASSAWQNGKRIMITTSSGQNEQTPWSTDDKQPAKLVWYNLDSAAPPTLTSVGPSQQPIAQASAGNYGVMTRNGDSNGVAFPAWSHDGSTIYYSSTNGGCMDGRLAQGATDIYGVPYSNGDGGDAKAVAGASEKSWEEYYVSIAPDDSMLLFDRVPSGEVMYANPHAELYLVPIGSAPGAGKAVRLAANDPVSCTGKASPGVNNHFPKWAPKAASYNGRTYYWVIYSSNRTGLPKQSSKYDSSNVQREISQLYLTAISLEKDGTYKTYKSIYLWWQAPPTDPTPLINTTPVWDIIAIPPAQPIY